MNNYPEVDMHGKKSDKLVIHCADPRFQKAYRHLIDNWGKHYDLLVLPGASKAVVDDAKVTENIKLLHSLHNFGQVHIMDHVDCGAFGKVEDELESHQQSLKKAERLIIKALPEIEVYLHLLGEDSEIEIK